MERGTMPSHPARPFPWDTLLFLKPQSCGLWSIPLAMADGGPEGSRQDAGSLSRVRVGPLPRGQGVTVTRSDSRVCC